MADKPTLAIVAARAAAQVPAVERRNLVQDKSRAQVAAVRRSLVQDKSRAQVAVPEAWCRTEAGRRWRWQCPW